MQPFPRTTIDIYFHYVPGTIGKIAERNTQNSLGNLIYTGGLLWKYQRDETIGREHFNYAKRPHTIVQDCWNLTAGNIKGTIHIRYKQNSKTDGEKFSRLFLYVITNANYLNIYSQNNTFVLKLKDS